MPFPTPYMELFNASALAVKGVNPSYRVGGPATAQLNGDLGNVAAFVTESTTRGIPFDFVSTHFYPSSGDRTSFKPCSGGDDWDPSCFAQQMALTRAAIPEEYEFLLTEYNAGCCMQYYQHDNSGAAAFAFRSVGEAAGITDVLSWWSFTDVFEEGNQIEKADQKSLPEFSDVYGLMTFHGVPKPGWRAFALLHSHAGALRLPTEVSQPTSPGRNASLISAFATVHEAGGQPSVFLSFWENGGPPSYRDNRTVTVAVKGRAAPSHATEYRIDEDHANPLAEWQAMGRPNGPSAAQLKALVAASEVTPTALVVSNGGAVTVTMGPNSAVVVVFKSDDSDTNVKKLEEGDRNSTGVGKTLYVNVSTPKSNDASRTWYVNSNATSDGDGTQLKPFLKISSGASVAMPGDTVLVATGVYRERVAPVNSGTENAPITYTAAPGARVVITAAEVLQWTPSPIQGGSFVAQLDDSMFDTLDGTPKGKLYNPFLDPIEPNSVRQNMSKSQHECHDQSKLGIMTFMLRAN